MGNKELSSINAIAKEVRNRIANQRYVERNEVELFQNTSKLAVAKFHKLGLMLTKYGHMKIAYTVDTDSFYKTMKLTTLKSKAKKLGNDFQLILDGNAVCVRLSDSIKIRSIQSRELISAFIFYSIAQGDFISNLKTMNAADFRKEKIIKVPNPFIPKHLIEHLTTELENTLIATLFSLVTFILEQAETVAEPIKVTKKFALKPLRKTIANKQFSNCQADAKANDLGLGMVEISKITYLKHNNLFKSVVGYEGGDVSDWQYFRYMEGAINAGLYEDRYAVSPSLGIKRNLNISEYYNVGVIGKIG